jgi:hypothetical protein
MDLSTPARPAGPPARTRSRSVTALLRQVWWASVPVWSIGYLSFAPFLRLALGRRRRKDWAVFAAYAAAVAVFVVLTSIRTTGATTVLGGALIFGLMGTASVHSAVEFRPSRAAPSRTTRQANRHAIEAAHERMRWREQARKLAIANPALARDLRIGRPDLPRDYDDGGLVDVNHAPRDVLAAHLGLRADEVATLLAARDRLGAFSGPEELTAYEALPPDRVDDLRDLMIFSLQAPLSL